MTNKVNAAIYFHQDGFDPNATELNGRRVAGESFLRGFAQHCGSREIAGSVPTPSQEKLFRAFLDDVGFDGTLETRSQTSDGLASDAEVLQLPGPSLGDFAWLRASGQRQNYSLCGVTHTTATTRIMRGMWDSRTDPVEEWDGIITTSLAVQKSMQAVLDASDDFLKHRFGSKKLPPRFQMPVIPLGIHTEDFAHNAADRASWRNQLGVAEDDILVLTVSRLNSFGKFDPLPLFRALKLAADRTETKIHFLAVGPYSDNPTRRIFENGARALMPKVTFHHIDGTKIEQPKSIWSAADIFTHPVDNIQETFGLAPVEAMAASLPVVVSDWDGFKDTITPDAGFRIETLGPNPEADHETAKRYFTEIDSYAQYLGLTALRTVIDIPKMADAFAALFADESLRKKMGAAGLKRATSVYDWAAIIPQYQEFWGELAAIRKAKQKKPKQFVMPLAMDQGDVFASYPTGPAELGDQRFTAVENSDAKALVSAMWKLHEMPNLNRVTVQPAILEQVLTAVQRHPGISFKKLSNGLPPEKHDALRNGLLFLLKFDLLRKEPV